MTWANDIEGWRNRLRAAAVDYAAAEGDARDRAADELENAAHSFARSYDEVALEHEENGEVCCEACGEWVKEETARMDPEDAIWFCEACCDEAAADEIEGAQGAEIA